MALHAWVDVDGHAGAADAVDHLVDRGHRRIAWLGWQETSFIGEDRRGGWLARMAHHGLATEGWDLRGDDTVEFGRRASHALLDRGEPPTALVCVSDTVAMGALHALVERGVHPGPQGIGVVGFDDSYAAQLVPPGLTSVRQPLEQVGVEVVRLLKDRLELRPSESPHVILSPELVVRGSS
jgi:LacI family transcriptional regulator